MIIDSLTATGLLALSLAVLAGTLWLWRTSWRDFRANPRNENAEHGLVVSSTFVTIAAANVAISVGFLQPGHDLVAWGSVVVRGALAVTVVYLITRAPRVKP